ncbi:Cpe/LpqF family protein [Humidisolicoccus flavus]|uniref:Cpe/LpqF family protein n=1 Tax=Humidisolicoccus flavus TaxID=3111414 RepID=UPI0032485DC3
MKSHSTTARTRKFGAPFAAAIAALLVLTGCSADSAPEEPSEPSASEASQITIPDTAVGETAEWVLGVLNSEDDTTVEQWAEVLHPDAQAELAPEELATVLNEQIRPAHPFVPVNYEGDETQSVTTLQGALGEPLDMSIMIDDEGLIQVLFFGPVAEP